MSLFKRKEKTIDPDIVSRFKGALRKNIFTFDDAKKTLIQIQEYSDSNIQMILNDPRIIEVGDSHYQYQY
jgi:hypothetical protein